MVGDAWIQDTISVFERVLAEQASSSSWFGFGTAKSPKPTEMEACMSEENSVLDAGITALVAP